MSTLNQKVSAHLDEQYPPEFDEKWVNKLLTDKETPNKKRQPNLQELNRRKATMEEMALLEAEIRRQRIIRKAKSPIPTNEPQDPKQQIKRNTNQSTKKSTQQNSLSAIQRQKQDFTKKKESQARKAKAANSNSPIRRVLSRITSR